MSSNIPHSNTNFNYDTPYDRSDEEYLVIYDLGLEHVTFCGSTALWGNDERTVLDSKTAASSIATIFLKDRGHDTQTLPLKQYQYHDVNRSHPESSMARRAAHEWAEAWGEVVVLWFLEGYEKAKEEEARRQQQRLLIPQTCIQLIQRIRYYLLHVQSRHPHEFTAIFYSWNIMDIAVTLGDNNGQDVVHRKFDKIIMECHEVYKEYSELNLSKMSTWEEKEDEMMENICKMLVGKKEMAYMVLISKDPNEILDGYKRALETGQIEAPTAANFLAEIEGTITKRQLAATTKSEEGVNAGEESEQFPKNIGKRMHEFRDFH